MEVEFSLVAPNAAACTQSFNQFRGMLMRAKVNQVSMCLDRGYRLKPSEMSFYVTEGETMRDISIEDFVSHYAHGTTAAQQGAGTSSKASAQSSTSSSKQQSYSSSLPSSSRRSPLLQQLSSDCIDADGKVVSVIFLDNTRSGGEGSVHVLDQAIGVEHVRDLAFRVAQNSIGHVILVTGGKLSHEANALLKSLTACRIETFDYVFLAVARHRHSMVPPHTLLRADEYKGAGLDDERKRACLPCLSFTDPQARRLGARVGDVVRVDHVNYGFKGLNDSWTLYMLVIGKALLPRVPK